MEVVKEEDIAIICMSNHYLIHSKKICLLKCIWSILNIVKRKDLIVKIQILKDLEGIEDKEEDKNNQTRDKDQDQKTEKNKKREDTLHQGPYLKIEEI